MLLQYGDRNDNVREMQAVLNLISAMWNRPDFYVGAEDGIFGSQTQQGVINFQAASGMPQNGNGDDATLTQMAYVLDAFTSGNQTADWRTDPLQTQRNDNYTSQAPIITAHKTKIRTMQSVNPYPITQPTGGIDWKIIGIISAIVLGLVLMNMGKKK